MSLIPWRSKQREGERPEPSPLGTLRTEMDRLFDTYLREPLAAIDWPLAGAAAWAPAVDVAEDEKQITVRAEIPGIDPKDVDVTVTGNQLVISGEKKESSERKEKSLHVRESRYGSFRRVVPLPTAVESKNVEAHCANGVLTVTLPKTQSAAAKRIDVKVSGK